ncbi:MAG: mobile mystery protein A [Coxiellaceae bacterium]|nr:mobile mystery protein A [Coxiellaceae bacterium]
MSKLYNIAQFDKKLSADSAAFSRLSMPRGGWIKAIRTTLGLTYKQLAKRVGVSRRRILMVEHAEVEQKLKLETLAKVADAMGCELHYVLVPKKGHGLLQQVEQRAMEKARQIVISSGQHMSLEDQFVDKEIDDQVRILAQEILHKNLKGLWDE